MSWVKMDDRWPSNRKLRRVEPQDRLMWVMSIAYTSDQRTDGRLDGAMLEYVAYLAGVTLPYEAAGRLVEAGLFDLDAGSWWVHDFAEYQPTTKQIEAKHEAKVEAGRVGGLRSGETRKAKAAGQEPDRSRDEAVASGSLQENRSPSRPVPSQTSSPTPPRGAQLTKLLNAVAWKMTENTPGIRSRGGYQKALVDKAEETGLTDQLEALLRRHPDAELNWLVDEHLGQPHPRAPYTPPDPREAARALKADR